jgi:hypothetical protein
MGKGLYEPEHSNGEKRLFASSYLSVRLPAQNNSSSNGRMFIKFDIPLFSKVCRER